MNVHNEIVTNTEDILNKLNLLDIDFITKATTPSLPTIAEESFTGSGQISRAFSSLGISITNAEILKIEKMVINFENRGTHILALNGQLLGVYPMAFTDADKSNLFDIFTIKEKQIKDLMNTITAINKNHKVASEPFNIFSVWLMHLAFIFIEKKDIRERFLINVAKYLHYRMFTSFVKHMLPHGANEDVMLATVRRLTRRSDIVTYETWKRVIEVRCEDLISETSIHLKTLQTPTDDAKFLYVITDIQTRIREKTKAIIMEYHQTKESGGSFGSRSSTAEIDGTKIYISNVSSFDSMVSGVIVESTNQHIFINQDLISKISGQFSAISAHLLRQTLTIFSTNASEQRVTKQQEKKVEDHEGTYLSIGTNILIRDIIQSSFSYCVSKGISLTNKGEVYIKIKNIYSASRINDIDINRVKNSVSYIIDEMDIVERESTRASLRIAFIMYIIVKAMRYL